MQLIQMTYEKTIQHYDEKGHTLYEPEKLSITVAVEQGESSREVFETLKSQGENLLGIGESDDIPA